MKRRQFLLRSAGLSSFFVPLVGRTAALPCPPPSMSINGTQVATANCQIGPTGFASRPYFFQPDAARLRAYISNGDASATGSAANNAGSPIGFITIMNATLANRSGYSDMATWNLALAGWLTGNTTMQDKAKAECLAMVRSNPQGAPLASDAYQHIEDTLLDTALVADCCYSRFSASELNEVATYVNGALTYAEGQDRTFWPYGDPHNNYWNNRHLAMCIGGICSEGWNPQAASWRLKFEAMSGVMTTKYTSPFYSGPQVTEGHYYSCYIAHSMWALRQYDAVVGTNFLASLSFTARDTLNLALYQLRPHNAHFFSIGSEAANSVAPFHPKVWQLWYQMIFMASNSIEGRVARAIVQSSAVTGDPDNFWSRNLKAFTNFYWPIAAAATAQVNTKTDRRLVLPTPGGASTYLRSAQGWDTSATRRAAVIFHSRTGWAADSPGYSHANVDQPGFQWGQNDQWLAMDPEVRGKSGIDAEQGSAISSDFANIVTLSSRKEVPDGAYPVCLANEDNTNSSVPHYYVAIDAQPYWKMCSVYRREYVWMDDLQVVFIFDRVATAGADTKTWRLSVDTAPTISNGTATVTTTKGTPLAIRDLYTTGGTPMTAVSLVGVASITQPVFQLRQADPSSDFVSVKVLSVNNRISAVALTRPDNDKFQIAATIGGVVRTIVFRQSGAHATVA